MGDNPRQLASSIVAATLLLWHAETCICQEQPAKTTPSPSYASPAEAFAAFQQGWKDADGEADYGCVTDSHRNVILLHEWNREFSLRFPGPHIKRIVSKYVDEKRRLELTCDELPLRQQELASILVRSVKDPKAAFLDLVQNLDEKSRRTYTAGELVDISSDCNVAQGVLKLKDDPTRIVCHFVKKTGGWLYEREAVGDAPPEAERRSPQTKRWTNRAPAKFASPQDVTDEFHKAIAENDPEAAWNFLTDAALGQHLWWVWLGMSMDEGEGSRMDWYLDIEKLYLITAKRLQNTRENDEDIVKAELQALYESIRDRKVYFSAGIKGLSGLLHGVPAEHRNRPVLRNLQIMEDRATGVLTLVLHDPQPSMDDDEEKRPPWYETNLQLTFKRSNDAWRIDSVEFAEDESP